MRVAAAGGHDEFVAGGGRAPAVLEAIAVALGEAELGEALHAVDGGAVALIAPAGTVARALSQALLSTSCSSWRHSRGFRPAWAAAARRMPRGV